MASLGHVRRCLLCALFSGPEEGEEGQVSHVWQWFQLLLAPQLCPASDSGFHIPSICSARECPFSGSDSVTGSSLLIQASLVADVPFLHLRSSGT